MTNTHGKTDDIWRVGSVRFADGLPLNGIICDGADMYIVKDGVKIAKRGRPGTKHAKQWIALEPGFVVRDIGSIESIVIEYVSAGAALQ